MKGKGINKRLYERRLELDYSTLEAAIRLDISKRYLYLIEHGYIRVKKELQSKFIRKYKLPADFFTNDQYLGYPTPIETPIVKTNKKTKHPIILNIIFALCMIGASIAAGYGLSMYPKINNETTTFYNQDVKNLRNYVLNNGVEKSAADGESDIATLVLDSYFQCKDEHVVVDEEIYDCSLNFFKLEENFAYAFVQIRQTIVPSAFEEGCYNIAEIRFLKDSLRLNCYHMPLNAEGKPDKSTYIRLSIDCNPKNNNTKINLIEVYNSTFGHNIVSKNDPLYLFYSLMFSSYFSSFGPVCTQFFNNNFSITFENFRDNFIKGNANLANYEATTQRLIVFGTVGFLLFFAILLNNGIKLTIATVKKKRLVPSTITVSSNEVIEKTNAKTDKPAITYKPLPQNSRFSLFVPEMALRIFALIILLISSIGIYVLFQNILDFNIGGIIQNIHLKNEIGSLTSVALTLTFFIKLNIQQNSKSKYKTNFIFFFLGLGYYFVLLIVQYQISTSHSISADISKELLNVLPGNFFWGTLSFNLLAAALFSNHEFKTKQKLKTHLVRLTSLIPIAYMVISAFYFTGKKMLGWDFPLAVTTLFFSKSTTLIIFAVLYCFFVYFYQKYTTKKYGPENAIIYRNGTTYNFVINIGVSAIVTILGIINVVLASNPNIQIPGLGSDSFILLTIPFILFYRQHLGDRNKKWDIAFVIMFGTFIALGMLMIAGSLSDYISAI